MIAFKLKQDFYDLAYIKSDDEQKSYTFIGCILLPGQVKYLLSDGSGELIELYEGEIAFERNEALRLAYNNNE